MRTLLLGDVGNRLDIADNESRIKTLRHQQRQAKREIRRKERTIQNLDSELAQQKLAVQALTRFLVSKKIVDPDELNEFIKEVDAEDGVVDGMMKMKEVWGEAKMHLKFDR